MNFSHILLLLAIISTALVAGLFFAWTISVIPGFEKIPDRNYLEAMQSINKEILNPAFYLIFFGSIICLPILAVIQFRTGLNPKFWMVLAAVLIYFIGTIGITMFGNVPMNNGLEAVDLSSLPADQINSTRLAYEGRWNAFNLTRTIASCVSFVMLLLVYVDGE